MTESAVQGDRAAAPKVAGLVIAVEDVREIGKVQLAEVRVGVDVVTETGQGASFEIVSLDVTAGDDVAFARMVKFDIAELERAAAGEARV